MKRTLTSRTDSLVYPGLYHPLPEVASLHNGHDIPPKNILETKQFETEEYLKIEVNIPGARREDMVIHIENNIVSIIVSQKKTHKHIHHQVYLPSTVDPQFGNADYKDGILNIYFFKTGTEADVAPPCEIIIY